MRRLALLLPCVVAACTAASSDVHEVGEPVSRSTEPFTSSLAELLDFDLDGRLVVDASSVPDPKTLVNAQLLYAVGDLNAHRANARFELLELSSIAVSQTASERFEVRYHAKLPVAWADPAPPASYVLTLPARVGQSDQVEFAQKYGATCADPSGGTIGASDAGRLFLFYRPHQAGCDIDPSDVVALEATAAPATKTKSDTYPEYDRIWSDRALDVVAMFSRQIEGPREDANDGNDDGVAAYHEFLRRAHAYVALVQPDSAKRTEPPPADAPDTARFGAVLDDGRTLELDARLVGPELGQDGQAFDDWFDALTPDADLVLYNGHAGLGDNVRTLMTKGTFRPGKYVVWAANGCDTFAYVDRTLTDRRAALNPDDPNGTKYMDQVSNLMGGYFSATPTFAMSFIDAAMSATNATPDPRSYRKILDTLDPAQVAVVTGDEDNTFDPHPRASAHASPNADAIDGGAPVASAGDGVGTTSGHSGCAIARGAPDRGAMILAAGAFIVVASRRRRRGRVSDVGRESGTSLG